MREDEILERFLEVTEEMAGYECDEIDFTQKRGNTPASIELVFGAKYRRTWTRFYRLCTLNNCIVKIPNQDSIVFGGTSNRKTGKRVVEILKNQVVSTTIFDNNTYSLTIEFVNGLILTFPNDEPSKASFKLSSNFVPHPRGGRGLIFTVLGKQLLLGGWMS